MTTTAATRRLRRRRRDSRSGAFPAFLGAVLTIPVVLALAVYELKAIYAVAAVAAVLAVVYVLRLDLSSAARRLRRTRPTRGAAAADPVGPAQARAEKPAAAPHGGAGRSLARILGLACVAGAAAGAAWVLALLGVKGLIAALAAVVLIVIVLFVRDKASCLTFVTVASLALLLHKSLGPQDLSHAGGAISIYITSLDVLLILLYGLWMREGTFVRDLRDALARPLIWLPLVAGAFLLPSLLVATDMRLALAELVRMGWMYALYVYIAVRVRTVRHIWAVLLGLTVFVAVELTVVLLQWRTGGVLGLEFLGIPESLIPRTTDAAEIGRPSGTILHPAFLAAALGITTMLALALAIEMRNRLLKAAAVVIVAAGLTCMWVSQTRAAFVAVGMTGLAVIIAGLVRRRLRWRTLGVYALLGAVALALLWPRIRAKYADNFTTAQFTTEIASRLQLNDIALRIINDHPLLGVGLNNYEVVMPRYQANPVIFPEYPVHNLYLLWLGEVGILGFAGVVVLGVALYDSAFQLSRNADPLSAAIGIGAAGAMAFVMIEELLGYTLRGDVPLALYWVVAGLVAAATTMNGRTWPTFGARALPARGPGEVRGAATAEGATGRQPARLFRVLALTSCLTLMITLAPLVPGLSSGPGAEAAPVPKMTFTAQDRSTMLDGIYLAHLDGTDPTKISPDDGRSYSWGRFAYGNTKIVYTVDPVG